MAERYERGSVMITSNLPFSKWEQIFKDPMTTAATGDRGGAEEHGGVAIGRGGSAFAGAVESVATGKPCAVNGAADRCDGAARDDLCLVTGKSGHVDHVEDDLEISVLPRGSAK